MTTAEHNGADRRDDEFVAAEYVLGVLPEAEREAAARRIETELSFARLVDEWAVRLAPLDEAFEPVSAPPSVKTNIDRRLFLDDQSSPARGGLWSSLALWRASALAAFAALVVFAALTYRDLLPLDAPDAPRLIASLAHDDTDVRYLVVYDGSSKDVALSHVDGARPEGRDFELWAIGSSGEPVSLGVVPVGSSVHLALNEALGAFVDKGVTFAITTEPLGGSPSGAPTGPVVALGDLREI